MLILSTKKPIPHVFFEPKKRAFNNYLLHSDLAFHFLLNSNCGSLL